MSCVVFQAAILQQTAEYIFTLEQEKTRLLQQNSQLKRIIQVQVKRCAWICPDICSGFSAFKPHILTFWLCSPGAKRFFPEEKTCRGERRRHRLTRHSGGGKDWRPEEGDDWAEAAAGKGAYSQNDAGGSGNSRAEEKNTHFHKLSVRKLTWIFPAVSSLGRCAPWMLRCTQRSWRPSPSWSRSSKSRRQVLFVCQSS